MPVGWSNPSSFGSKDSKNSADRTLKSFYSPVLCGVRQGGILSPILFAIYVDSLISDLRQCSYGLYIDTLFVGCVVLCWRYSIIVCFLFWSAKTCVAIMELSGTSGLIPQKVRWSTLVWLPLSCVEFLWMDLHCVSKNAPTLKRYS